MKKVLVIALAATIFHADVSAQSNPAYSMDNTLSEQERSDGWTLLFDGKTTTGWHTYGYNSVGNAWNVADGTLHLNLGTQKEWPSGESHDILTNDEYGNFHLKVDWKISKNGNSGIIFNIHEDKAKYRNTYETGPEMQVLDNAGHPDAKIPRHRAGDLYDLIASSSEPVKPAEQWNHAEIISENGHLRFLLNGVQIVATTLWNDDWKQLVQNSKFKTMADFGTFKQGKIALQEHGNEAWFKNVKIKRL